MPPAPLVVVVVVMTLVVIVVTLVITHVIKPVAGPFLSALALLAVVFVCIVVVDPIDTVGRLTDPVGVVARRAGQCRGPGKGQDRNREHHHANRLHSRLSLLASRHVRSDPGLLRRTRQPFLGRRSHAAWAVPLGFPPDSPSAAIGPLSGFRAQSGQHGINEGRAAKVPLRSRASWPEFPLN